MIFFTCNYKACHNLDKTASDCHTYLVPQLFEVSSSLYGMIIFRKNNGINKQMAPFCFHKAFIYTCPTKEACKSLDTFLAKDGKEKDKLRTDIQKQLNIRNGFSAVSYKKQG